MKKLLILATVFFICGCKTTEDPPAWWNPSGKYSNGAAAVPDKTPAKPAAAVAVTPKPAVQPVKETYEDTFTPVVDQKVEVIKLDAPSVLEE